MTTIPEPFRAIGQDYPDLMRSYEELAAAAHNAGPLDERTRRLVKLGISVGARLEGAVRSHVAQARDAGVPEAEIDHVMLLAITTIGLPSAVAARTWAGGVDAGGGS